MARDQKSWHKAVMVSSNLATTLAGLVGGGFFLGRYLDTRWGTQPLLTLGLILSGLALGASYFIITLKKEFGASDDKE